MPTPPNAPAPSPTSRTWQALSDARAHLRAHDDATLRAQVDLAGIPAPTGHESARGQWMAERFARLGLTRIRTDDAGNVRAWRDGRVAHDAVLVCAHLDTVFPIGTNLAVRTEGGRLVGAGIGDNARGLAAILAVGHALQATRVRTERPICFVATTGEEGAGDLAGARHLFASLDAPPFAAIIIDGPGDDRVVHRAVGSRRFRVTFTGPGGHSWADFGTPNAVHAAARYATRLTELTLPTSPRTTLTVGRIGGGTSVNSIAAEAWLEIDLRSTGTSMLDRFEREIHRLAQRIASEASARHRGAALQVHITTIGARPSGEMSDAHPLVQSAMEATRLIGRTALPAIASTDANIPLSLGVPAIAIGAGGTGGAAHSAREWYDNTDGALGLERALAVVVQAAGLVADERPQPQR